MDGENIARIRENFIAVSNQLAIANAEIERLDQERVDLTEAILDWYRFPSREACAALEALAERALTVDD